MQLLESTVDTFCSLRPNFSLSLVCTHFDCNCLCWTNPIWWSHPLSGFVTSDFQLQKLPSDESSHVWTDNPSYQLSRMYTQLIIFFSIAVVVILFTFPKLYQKKPATINSILRKLTKAASLVGSIVLKLVTISLDLLICQLLFQPIWAAGESLVPDILWFLRKIWHSSFVTSNIHKILDHLGSRISSQLDPRYWARE